MGLKGSLEKWGKKEKRKSRNKELDNRKKRQNSASVSDYRYCSVWLRGNKHAVIIQINEGTEWRSGEGSCLTSNRSAVGAPW